MNRENHIFIPLWGPIPHYKMNEVLVKIRLAKAVDRKL